MFSGLFLPRAFAGTTILMLALTFSDAIAQSQASRLADRRYEDLSTFKNKSPYIVDPYVWAYSRTFADLYRMPEDWVNEELKGALAVAFRMNAIGNLTCGLAGKADNCWPPVNCQLDVYYDNKIKLPWVHDDIVRDFMMPGTSSRSHLVQSNPSVVRRYVPADPQADRGVMVRNSVRWVIPPKVSGAIWTIVYYDKEFQPNIGLIGFQGLCPTVPNSAEILFYDPEAARRASRGEIGIANASPIHAIVLPQAFMKRSNEIYVRQNKKKVELTERLLEQHRDAEKTRQSDRPGGPK